MTLPTREAAALITRLLQVARSNSTKGETMSEYNYDCKVFCNDGAIYPAMYDLVKNKEMSVNAAAKFVHEDSGGQVSVRRAAQVYENRTPSLHKESAKPTKKQTKEGVKLQLDNVTKEIKAGKVSDDDTKKVGDAIAEAIDKGTSAKRVGTRVATAVKKADKKFQPVELKPIDNFYRLKKHIISAIEGLTFWADKTMEPETREEAECAKIILASGANMIVQCARLGIDVEGIYQTFIEGDRNDENRKENEHC